MEQSTSPPDLRRASLSDLLDLQGGYEDAVVKFKARIAAVQEELSFRYASSAVAALVQQGKEHGSGKLPLQDGFAVTYKVDREVKWDSEKLLAVAQTLPWERVNAIFKIGFSVPEAIYKGIAAAAPDLREKIDEARTTTIKPAKLSLVKE